MHKHDYFFSSNNADNAVNIEKSCCYFFRVMNVLKPGSIKKINNSALPFKEVVNTLIINRKITLAKILRQKSAISCQKTAIFSDGKY